MNRTLRSALGPICVIGFLALLFTAIGIASYLSQENIKKKVFLNQEPSVKTLNQTLPRIISYVEENWPAGFNMMMTENCEIRMDFTKNSGVNCDAEATSYEIFQAELAFEKIGKRIELLKANQKAKQDLETDKLENSTVYWNYVKVNLVKYVADNNVAKPLPMRMIISYGNFSRLDIGYFMVMSVPITDSEKNPCKMMFVDVKDNSFLADHTYVLPASCDNKIVKQTAENLFRQIVPDLVQKHLIDESRFDFRYMNGTLNIEDQHGSLILRQ